ncbi:MAG: CDP-alcohol phosphatidyltransferase family protein [Allosphingosinicella sp.]
MSRPGDPLPSVAGPEYLSFSRPHGVDGEGWPIRNRRPLRSRETGWAQGIARGLLRTGLSADQVSLLGILFAGLGAAAYALAPQWPWLFLAGALAIQLRLLCNLFDGMIAVEGGRKSPYGPLFNEAPDRIEDSLFLIAFGYAGGLLWLGLLAALLACLTAYVRVLGGSFGLAQDFVGPMAKQHRMAVLTFASVLAAVEAWAFGSLHVVQIALWIVVAGAAWTAMRRTLRIAAAMKAAS